MTPFAAADVLGDLQTEAHGRLSLSMDTLDTLGLCKAFNREEAGVSSAIAQSLPTIASLIEELAARLRIGGRLIYVGAGNSGRVAFMDCSELPVTFSTQEEQFLAVIAGGNQAILKAQEQAEDSEQDGAAQLNALQVTTKDTIIGISASGRTPFVVGALREAFLHGALTVAITNSTPSRLEKLGVGFCIAVPVGPEFIAGSTRLKAGSAAKQILNMISTCTMVKLGKTYMGLMIDVRAKNYKLRARGRRIIRQVCQLLQEQGYTLPNTLLNDDELNILIEKCGGSIKLSCAVVASGLSPEQAQHRLDLVGGNFQSLVKGICMPALGQPNGTSDTESDNIFLSIDGGGTKCAVSIVKGSTVIARARSGPCNFHTVPMEDVIRQIMIATTEAVRRLPQPFRSSFQDLPKFTAVWAGIAGIHYAHERETFTSRLEKMFMVSVKAGSLQLTSDSALLGSCVGVDDDVDCGISLIAGTGSVATAFKKDSGGNVVHIGRSGGWGHLLGDYGSAFDIGKHALQALLTSLDLSQGSDMNGLSELESEILATSSHGQNQLLSQILYSDVPPKHLISDFAKVVTSLGLRADNPDPQALEILTSAARSLVRLIKPLMKKQICDPSHSSLILSGALLNLSGFRALVLDELAQQSLSTFRKITIVDDASGCAAQFLARRGSGKYPNIESYPK